MELIFIVVVIEYSSPHGTFPRWMLGRQKFGNLVTISEMFFSFCHFINKVSCITSSEPFSYYHCSKQSIFAQSKAYWKQISIYLIKN